MLLSHLEEARYSIFAHSLSTFNLQARLFQTVFCFAFFGSYIFISDQNVNAKSNRNRNCIFFILLEIPLQLLFIISPFTLVI